MTSSLNHILKTATCFELHLVTLVPLGNHRSLGELLASAAVALLDGDMEERALV